ncbi:MAG: hypothetical protein Q8S84_01630 [bacterium]|nr:hypothetical protein [bacterium]MDP3380267.1 hypothetical protein [bacterium]
MSSPIMFAASIASISSVSFNSCAYTDPPHEKFALKSHSLPFLSIDHTILPHTKNILKS